LIFDYYEGNPNVNVLGLTISRQGTATPIPDLDRLRVDFTMEVIFSEESTPVSKAEFQRLLADDADYMSYIMDYARSIESFSMAHTVRFSETEAAIVVFPLFFIPAASSVKQIPSEADRMGLLNSLDHFFKDVLVAAGLPVVRFSSSFDDDDITYSQDGTLFGMDFTGVVAFEDDAPVPTPSEILTVIQGADLEDLRVNYLGQAPTTGSNLFTSVVAIGYVEV
jgi:hypothetical protein